MSQIENLRTDRVTDHALKVVSEKGGTWGNLHRLACKRHLKDLERQRTEKFAYYWDVDAAHQIIDFAETLTIAEGYEQTQLRLTDEQAFIMGSLMGWLNLKGYRRFRRSYISMARQNGKTFLNGIIGTYLSAFSGYQKGKLFTVATGKRQAKLAWEQIRNFIKVDRELNELFVVREWKSTIECTYSDCTIEALSKEAGLDEGFRSIYSSIDEIHQHKDNSIYKAIYNGTRALQETLVSMISTRGDNLNSFAKEMDDYAVNILHGVAVGEDFFIDIFALDKNDDPFDADNWIKANPFLARTEHGMEILTTDAGTAKDMGGQDLRDFLIKALNQWVQNSDDMYIDVEKWAESGSARTLEDFRTFDTYVGLDLSSGGDLTTIALEIPYIDAEGKECYFIHSHSFMPRGQLVEHIHTDLAPYDLWEQSELLTVTGGDNDYINDYKFIIKELGRLVDEYELNIKGIAIDPHNADAILSDLEDFGVPILIVRQTARELNDATVDFRLSVKSGLVEYNQESELLTWSMGNAKTVSNSMGEIKVDKRGTRFKRIDPVDAVIDAHHMMMKSRNADATTVEDGYNAYLEAMGIT